MNQQFSAKFENYLPIKQIDVICKTLSNDETSIYENTIYVEVSNLDYESSKYYLLIKSELPTTFFKGLFFFGSFLVISVENFVYVYNLVLMQANIYKIGGYFDKFIQQGNRLLVVTNSRIGIIKSDGTLGWISDKLGVEKIELNKIATADISGRGKWNDKQGWIDFSLNPETGNSLIIKESQRKSKIIVSRITQMLGF